jgi:Flp pilus assembly protein TadG
MRKMKYVMRIFGRHGERGATLVFFGLSLTALLGIMSLAVDLGMLYVGRNDAQRAADAAALAGARSFATSCLPTDTCGAGTPDEVAARTQAELVGAQNRVLGQSADIQNSDITFNYPYAYEPQITVTVQRSAARGNAVPLIFGNIFGHSFSDVSATATAEAYNGPAAYSCVSPFLVPNCDPNPPAGTTAPQNLTCADYTSSGSSPYTAYEFVAPPGSAGASATIYSSAIGQVWQLHAGNNSGTPSKGVDAAAPSQWYLLSFPSCGSNPSAQCISQEIQQCSPTPINCGDTIQTAPGNKVGPVTSAVNQRINAIYAPQNGGGPYNGQDTIVNPVLTPNTVGPQPGTQIPSPSVPFSPALSIKVGEGNPSYNTIMKQSGGTGLYPGPSPSILTLPLYDGHALNPGNTNSVTVVGFIQLFVVDAYHSGTSDVVDSVITNISGCGSEPATITAAGGGGGVPIRLIQAPTPTPAP